MRETTGKRTAMRATTGVLESAQIGFFFLCFEKEVSCREGFVGQGEKKKKKKKKKKKEEKKNGKGKYESDGVGCQGDDIGRRRK
jgi:hypothetical protein